MKFRGIRWTATAAVLAGMGLAATAQAAEMGGALTASLTGAAEKPTAGAPGASGTASVRVDLAKGQACYDLAVQNVGAVTMAHIHKAPPGSAGPVVVPLQPPGADGKVSACASADPAVLKDIQANPGDYYVNVHTAAFPAGAARGQLSK